MAAQLIPPSWTSQSIELKAVFDLLVHYLEDCANAEHNFSDPSSHPTLRAAAATVQRLDELFSTVTQTITTTIETDIARPKQAHPFPTWRSVLRDFFATLFHVVIQTTPVYVEHTHLVNLLLAIRTAPTPQDPPPEFYETGGTAAFWTDLPTWRSVWADFERGAPLPSRSVPLMTPAQTPPWPEQPLTAAQWTTLNAFLAKLHTTVPDLKFVDVRGLFALIDALEDTHGVRTLDALVPAAAWWVIEAGEALAEQALRGRGVGYSADGYEDGSRRLPSSHGDLWLGPSGFNEERWEFWRTRFETIAGQESVTAETREIAMRAADWMGELQRLG